MKKTFNLAVLGLLALACCFLISGTKTYASPVNDGGFQSFVEKSEQIEGDLEIVAECEETDGRTLYFVNTESGRIQLQLEKSPRVQLTTGSHVRVTGRYVRDSFVVSDDIQRTDSNVQDLTSTGEHKVLVILINFQDRPVQPFTPAHAADVAFNTVSSYYRENSYGQTWLTGDVYGWYTVPLSSTVCDKTAISNAAKQAAINGGAILANYQHLVFAFPQTSACAWNGSSTVAANPAQAWINSDSFGAGALGHELGHGFGLMHSRSMDCGTVVIGGTCTSNEYGDYFDLMGPGVLFHFNSYQKERLGWLNGAGSPPLQTVTASGTYSIDAYETVGSSPKALKILRSVDPVTGWRTWYYIEHRTPTGFDAGMSVYNVQNGVNIHTGTEGEGEENYLLDLTPMTASWYDSMLNAGQSFTDAATGIRFTALSAGTSGASVQIEMAPQACTRANPILTVSPGQSPGGPAGSTVNFSLTLTNNDSGNCGASAFNLQAAVPANWVAAFATPAPVVNPGESVTTTLQVTSATGAATGFYPVVLSATNASSPTNTASASVQVQIAPPPCVRSNPTLTVSQAQSPGLPSGSTVTFDLMVRNNDTGGCGSSTFNLQVPVWANWNAAFDAPRLIINQGSSASTTLRVTSPVGAAVGLYGLTLTAANASSPANTASATVQIQIVAAPCVRSNPTLIVSPAQGPSVPTGSIVNYTLSVRNNDSGSCGASVFNFQAPVPANWSGAFGSSTISMEQGASATTNLQVTSAAGAPDGTYPISISAQNSASPANISAATVTYTVMSALVVTAAPTQNSYTRNQTATINTTVRAGTAVVAGATVTYTMTKSNGTVVTATRTTGSNGVATFSYSLSRKKDPTGAYQVRAQANSNGMAGTGNTNFTVR